MEKFDILKETIELYRLQKERVEIDFNMEKMLKKTFPALSNDVRVLKDLLTDIEARQEYQEEEEPECGFSES